MTKSTIKENIEVLVRDGNFWNMNTNRREFLNCKLSDIEHEIKNSETLKDIKNLLKLKYSLAYEITNVELAPIILIAKTVAITEILKWLYREIDFSSNILASVFSYLLALVFIYAVVFLLLGDYYNSRTHLFKQKRKKKIIQDLIDIEIEKRKKAPENNTSAKND